MHTGDCREVMATMEAESIDAIVTDPPYGLSFMGREWDHGVPGIPFWAEALRVAKPGAHLVAFGGSRTFHRLTCAVEDAGWEIRDVLMWVYGSGFPKSLDVSKAIDKEAGAVREVVGPRLMPDGRPVSDVRGQTKTDGWDRPWRSDPNAVAMNMMQTAPATDAARQWSGWGTALKPAYEPIILARKPLRGTVARNVQTFGTGAINVDGCRIAGNVPSVPQPVFNSPTGRTYGMKTGTGRNGEMSQAAGRWPANVLLDEAAAAVLDAQSGELQSPATYIRSAHAEGEWLHAKPAGSVQVGHGDRGGASRFFYTSKASGKDRGREEHGNDHPTVKPTDLMRWLCRLVTPPGGVVLDPFMGSGSTGVAAAEEGFRFIGIDLDPHHVEIAERRMRHATRQPSLL